MITDIKLFVVRGIWRGHGCVKCYYGGFVVTKPCSPRVVEEWDVCNRDGPSSNPDGLV